MTLTNISSLSSMSSLIGYSTTGLTDGETIYVNYYTNEGDLGGGIFQWNATSNAFSDTGVVILPTSNTATPISNGPSNGSGYTQTVMGFLGPYTGSISHTPIVPGTFSLSFTDSNGTYTATDFGNGELYIGTTNVGTIGYKSGGVTWSVKWLVAPASVVNITASYTYPSANGRWIRQYTGPVQDVFFGVQGNYLTSTYMGTDDTAAFQAFVNYCANHQVNVIENYWTPGMMPPTPGARYVTTSINATSSAVNNSGGYWKLYGTGAKIVGNLSVAAPILDLSGNNFCEINDLIMFNHIGSASCSILIAATSFNSEGGGGSIFNNVTVDLGFVNINADLLTFNNCDFSNGSGWAMICCPDNPTVIVSAYQTISTNPNTSLFTMNGGSVIGKSSTAGALWFDIKGHAVINGTYITQAYGAGSSSIPCTIRIDNQSYSCGLSANGMRVEDESGNTGLPAIQTLKGGMYTYPISLSLSGCVFYLAPTSYVFDFQPAMGTIQGVTVDGTLFHNGTALFTSGSQIVNYSGIAQFYNCAIVGSGGTGALASGSANISIVGATPANMQAFITANPTVPNITGFDNTGTPYFSNTPMLASVAVSASTANTVTNKVKVSINGTTYYLLASTSPT